MKTSKKILAILLALMMVTALCATAFAVDTGAGGPSSITISNVSLGKDYSIYKLFDANPSQDGSKIAYSLPAGKTIGTDPSVDPAAAWFTVDGAGNVAATAALTETVLKSAEFKTWAQSFGTQIGSTITADATNVTGVSSLVFENVPYGYYFITTSTGTAITVDSTKPTATVIDKNQVPPSVSKVFDLGNNQTATVNEANLDVDVTFKISETTTQYNGANRIYKYLIIDSIDPGMTYTSAPVVTVAGTTPTGANAPVITYYDKAWDDTTKAAVTAYAQAQSFDVMIPWTVGAVPTGASLYANDTEILVTYTAKLDSAKGNLINYTSANNNKARAEYFDDPTNPPNVIPNHNTPWSNAKTYDTQLVITKTDGSNAVLTGAEFTLTGTGSQVIYTQGTRFVPDTAGTFWLLKDGTYTTTDPATPGVDTSLYLSTTDKYKQETFAEAQTSAATNSNVKAYVDANGLVTFSGLGAGSYKLSETKVPPGYNKIEDIEFTVAFDTSTEKFSATVTSPTGTNAPTIALDGTTNNLATTIVNNVGAQLPSTGGIGTTIFYVLGSCLLLGAAVLIITRKRMSREV